MATPLTDSINALTTYANEVTGASDTTLSDAVYTLAQGYAKKQTGSFTGNDSSTSPEIACDFYPDIIICYVTGIDETRDEYAGVLSDFIIRDICSISSYDYSSSGVSINTYSKYSFTGITNYNENTYGTRQGYATVDGSKIIIKHNTSTLIWGQYKSGCTYNYLLIKYTS